MADVLLEICVASVADACTAADRGADRLELNCALALGGLTPSLGLVAETRASVKLPILVLIRPRAGDFVYSDAEIKVMARDVDLALAHGADGVVFGALDRDGNLARDACLQLRRVAGNRPCVFHRAFDFCVDPLAALEQLIDLGFQRILTSGQGATAIEGAERIAGWRDLAAGRIEFLPAGGITPANVKEVVTRTGCNQVHASLRHRRGPAGKTTTAARLNAQQLPPDDCHEETDPDGVRGLKRLLDEHGR